MAEFNKNMLSPLGFSFNIKKLPEFNQFVQSVTLPGINLGFTERPSPFKSIPVFGDHVTFTELSVTFKINEDLGNYIEVYNWMQGIGFPDKFDQHREIADPAKRITGDGLETDAYLMIMSSNMQPIIRIDIEDLFPVSLSDITLDSRDTQVEYIEATATFKFLKYSFTPV